MRRVARGTLRRGTLVALIASGMAMPSILRAGEEVVDLFVEIPSVVAVDVRGDVTFDLSRLPGPRSAGDCENVFPPGSACKFATYDPTGSGSITVAVFDNAERGSATLEERVAPAWTGGFPGQLATTDLQARDPDEPEGKKLTPLKTVPAAVARTAVEARWITFVRSFRLVVPVSGLQETPREGIQTTVIYSVSHSD